MSYNWDAAFEDDPGGSDNPSSGDDEIRKLKAASRERLAKEHVWTTGIGAFAAHGWHKAGAALAFWTSAAPTNLPDGSMALSNGTLSKGRLWANSGSYALSVWNGSSWSGIAREITRVSIQGTLAATQGVVPPIVFPRTVTILRILGRIGTRPTDQAVLIDFTKRCGTASASLFASGTGRVTVSSAASYCLRTAGNMSTGQRTVGPTSWLRMDIDQVGGTTKGANLAIVIEALPK